MLTLPDVDLLILTLTPAVTPPLPLSPPLNLHQSQIRTLSYKCCISLSLFLKCFIQSLQVMTVTLFFPMNLQFHVLLFMVAMTNVQYNHMMVCTVHHLTTSIPRLLAEPMIVLHTFSKGIPAKAGSCDFILAIS